MKKQSFLNIALILTVTMGIISCNNSSTQNDTASKDSISAAPTMPKIKTEEISYKSDTVSINSFLAYDESFADKRPVVLVLPEWWGINDYTRGRAKQLAELGYLAIAIDIYGNGRTAGDPGTAMKMSGPFYQNPQLAKDRIDATISQLKNYPQADPEKIAAIGYCFGGAVVLNTARMGENFKGVVSFHGGLVGTPARKDLLKAKILVCHGDDDKFVLPAEVTQFKKQMDSIGADYTFKSYPGATHAFTNPEATANGKKFNLPIAYNAAADTASWKEMNEFFGRIFKN